MSSKSNSHFLLKHFSKHSKKKQWDKYKWQYIPDCIIIYTLFGQLFRNGCGFFVFEIELKISKMCWRDIVWYGIMNRIRIKNKNSFLYSLTQFEPGCLIFFFILESSTLFPWKFNIPDSYISFFYFILWRWWWYIGIL